MLQKIFIIFVATVLIVQIQNAECFKAKLYKRAIKDVKPNCERTSIYGCMSYTHRQTETLIDRINSKNVEPKPIVKKSKELGEKKKSWNEFIADLFGYNRT